VTSRSEDNGWRRELDRQFAHPVIYRGNTVVLGPLHYLVCTNLEGAMIWETTDGGDAWTNRLLGGAGLRFDRLDDGTLVLPR
jgi:hypothetical protein